MATLGEDLRDQRERLGLSLQQAEEATRIRAKLLRALENDDYEHLPNPGYVKGYVWSYAKFLELDPTEAVEQYRRQIGGLHRHEVQLATEPVVPLRRDQHAVPWQIALAVVAVVGLAALAVWGIVRVMNPPAEPPPVPPPIEETTTPAAESSPTTPPPAVEATESIEPTQTAGPFAVRVEVDGRSWMRITVDGDVEFEGTLEDGEDREYEVTDEVSVRIGAPSAVTVLRDGQPVEIPSGEVPTVVLSADEP